jgi:Cyclic nucleotide-binding domain
MHIESSITSISWIPSEAVAGPTKASFEMGLSHYDSAPPDDLGPDVAATIEELRAGDRLRFANHLRAFIDVDDAGNVTGSGYTGGGTIGATTIRVGKAVSVAAVSLPDLQADPELGDGWVRFTQTAGGRTGMPVPRAVKHPPFVQYFAPIAHATLELTLRTDGTSDGRLVGASAFPRHWVYDDGGRLVAKTAVIDYKEWSSHEFGKHTPWGDEDSPALVTEVETALERELSKLIMGGGKPRIRKVKEGKELVRQGDPGDELYLLLDGVVVVVIDGKEWAELGPGAVVGERAILEGGTRGATLRARTPCRVAEVSADVIDREQLIALSAGHRREEAGPA